MNPPSIAELIRANATTITDSVELYALILRHHPEATVPIVVAELRRQACSDRTEAGALKAMPTAAANDA